MAEFPALPLWTDAYLGDTTHLSTIEHGAYLLLLMAMWRSPDVSLPNDDKMLARFAKMTPGQWARIKPVLWGFFREEGDRITQGRLTDEHEAVRRKSNKQSDRAKARWLKNKKPSNAAAMPDECRNDATLTLTPSLEPKGSTEDNAREPRSPSEPRGFSEFWAAYAHKKGIGAARKAYALALRKSDPERIIDGARVYAATRDPRFIKNASTWLNQECWEDDPATNQRKETNHGRRTPVGSADPGFADRLARWDELDARTAEASGHSGHPDFDADGADGWRSSNDRWSDRSGGFGTVVPLLQARGG